MPQPSLSAVLVTGASGFIGRHLIRTLLAEGHAVLALQHRHPVAGATAGLTVIRDIREISTTTPLSAIINLAGARILGPPWTRRRRDALLASRLSTTAAVVALIGRLPPPLPALISASAIGYYGVRGDEPLDESAASQPIFQSQLCAQWELAAAGARVPGARVAWLRFGVVLGRDGGALPALLRPARLGLGAVMGSGNQGLPWIHVEDAVRLIQFSMSREDLEGAVNAVAPGHVTQLQFQQTLGRVLHRPVWLRVPAAPLRAVLGEMAQLLLDGQHVVPARAVAAGFTFRHPDLEGALTHLLRVECRHESFPP